MDNELIEVLTRTFQGAVPSEPSYFERLASSLDVAVPDFSRDLGTRG